MFVQDVCMEPFSKMLPYFDLKKFIISLSVLSKNYQNITKNVSKYYQTILDFVLLFWILFTGCVCAFIYRNILG